MKILVAIDSSPSSEVVLKEVAARPWPNASTICVINVLDLFAFPSGVGGVGPVTDAEGRAAEALVEDAAKRLSREGLEVTTTVTEGYPPTSIVAYASEWGADFIVVGSHGHGGISRFLLGSVAQSVVRGAHCSVEIVRERTFEGRTGMRILLATDGSDHSAVAAGSVASRPWPEGTEVKVVCSVKVVVPAGDPWFAAGEAGSLIEEHSRQARAYLDAGEKMMREAGLKASSSVLTDGAKASIVDEARDWAADLVVLGSHGRRGLNRILMGSVSEAVAMHAHCSVDVIRGEVPTPQE